MDLWLVAIPVADAQDMRHLFQLLHRLRVPMDPCAGDPRFETDASGVQRLLVIVTSRIREQLLDAGRTVEVRRDFADMPDPRSYVSPTNRFAEELARLRAEKGRR
jgi:hypothetical protein